MICKTKYIEQGKSDGEHVSKLQEQVHGDEQLGSRSGDVSGETAEVSSLSYGE